MEQQQNAKVKERETMQEAFQDKKYLIEQQKNILTFIQEQLEKFIEIPNIYDRLKYLYNFLIIYFHEKFKYYFIRYYIFCFQRNKNARG